MGSQDPEGSRSRGTLSLGVKVGGQAANLQPLLDPNFSRACARNYHSVLSSVYLLGRETCFQRLFIILQERRLGQSLVIFL